MPTIYDVAEQAEVSIATVSRVLNGKARVSPALRARVLAVSEELGYRPNRLARALAEGTTRAVGLMLPADISHPFYGILAEHVARCAMAHEHEVVVGVPSLPTLESYVEAAADLQDRRIVGLLLCAAAPTVNECVRARRKGSAPIVAVGCLPIVDCPVATVDEEAAGYALTRHLLSLGHQRIGCVGLGPSAGRSLGRESGHARAMREAGLACAPREASPTMEGGYAAVIGAPDPTGGQTALIAHNDAMALGLLRALHERGVSVPGDVAVAGFDNIAQGRFSIPSLTTVDLQAARQAETAVDLLARLVDVVEGEPVAASALVQPEMVIRESTGPTG
jgi:LacI family transcriptional regulator